MTTPRLSLTELIASQSEPHVPINATFRELDALVQLSVIDMDLAAPPGSPAAGDCYIVAASATGAWAGHENDVAYFSGGWKFATPLVGFVAYVLDEFAEYRFVAGSPGSWEVVPTSGGGSGQTILDVDATAAPAAGAFDDYAGGGFDGSQTRYLVTPTGGDVTLNGMAATNAVDGQITAVCNEDAANTIICANQVGTSAAANRFRGPGAGDVVIIPGQVKLFLRQGARWRAL